MIKRRLSYRISVYILLMLALVFLFVGVQTYQKLKAQMLENALDETALQAENVSIQVRYIFDKASLYAYQMALNPDIVEYLSDVSKRSDIRTHEKYKAVYDYLIQIKESSELHYLAWVANEEANFYLDSNGVVPEEGYDVAARPWYEAAMTDKGAILTEPYIEWSSKRQVISSIYPVTVAGIVKGFTVVDLKLDTLPLILEGSKSNPRDLSFLLSRDGDYLYHPDNVNVLTTHIKDQKDDLSKYQHLVFSDTGSPESIVYKGKAYYLMSYGIDPVDWRLVTLIDKKILHDEVNHMMLIIVTIMLMAFITTGVFIVWHVDRETAPYKLLVDFAERIEAGDYKQNIPEDYLKREDEMGLTCQSFQRVIDRFSEEHEEMEDKLSDQSKEIERQYAHIYETEKAVLLGHIVAGVAHEINTPLGIGITLTSHLEESTAKSARKLTDGTMTKSDLEKHFEALDESLPLLEQNLTRAADLVKSFKKVAVDQFSESEQKFGLREVLDSVILSLRAEYKRRPIRFEIDCAPELTVVSEPGVFTQIFTNLIMNAIVHGLDETVDGIVRITCYKKDEQLTIVVEDNGRGIPEAMLPQIFDPFFTTRREKGGSGLGMSIVLNLVEQKLQGKMRIESEVGTYTRFVIEVPATSN